MQIDSVNVLCRSHYLPLYSRVGAYDRAALDKRTLHMKGRELFECWAHEASLVRMELHPLMRWRMGRARKGDGIYLHMDRFGKEEKAYLKQVLAFVQSHGPRRKAICRNNTKVQADGGAGAKTSWRWRRCLTKAW